MGFSHQRPSRTKEIATRNDCKPLPVLWKALQKTEAKEEIIMHPEQQMVREFDLNKLAQTVHQANIKWWQNIETGEPIKRNKGELLALIHSEISEALEGERKDLMDDKLPHRKMAEVELVDAIIRILDYAAGFGYDIQGAYEEKMAYNATRQDHTHEARRIAGGKQF